MSVFTKNALIELLEEEIETLKTKNEEVSSRLVSMTKQMTKNRVAAKSVVEERDKQIAFLKEELSDASKAYGAAAKTITEERDAVIASVKEELSAASSAYAALKDYHEHSLEERDAEIYSLKQGLDSVSREYTAFKNYHDQSLEEHRAYTEQLASQAQDNETMLALKNAQTTLQLEMVAEQSDAIGKMMAEKDSELVKRNDTVCSLYSKLVATENELAQAKGRISQMMEMINALRSASSYMNEVLSHNV
jgi:chromosome segregation ATPase